MLERGEGGKDHGPERIQPEAASVDQPETPSSQSRESARAANERRAPVCVPAVSICHHARPEMKSAAASSVVAMAAPEAPPTTKGWTADGLVKLGPRMQHIPRVSAIADSERLGQIIREYEAPGIPLIIEGWNKTRLWPGDKLFGVDWLLEHSAEKIAVRDCVSRRDKEIMFSEFIEKSRAISEYAQEGEKERLYGKDAICPKEWHAWLMDGGIPDVLKPGSTEDTLELLPMPERVETLMCYYGIGDTFTAAHKDLCASSGHNLMCSAEREGSAFWFMTRSSDAGNAALYFQRLGAELDHETRVATPKEFTDAPFTVYVAEQRVGDLVLVPRRSCHQVVNHGGLTAKMSWSRMTIEGLSTAFHHELPLYRRVCRPETYRVRLLVYRALAKYTEDLEKAQQQLRANIPAVTKTSLRAHVRHKASSMASQLFTITPPSSPESLPSTLSSDSNGDGTDIRVTLTPEHERLIADVRILLDVYDKILQEEHHGDTQCEMRIPRLQSGNSSTNSLFACSSSGVPPIPIPEDTYHDGLTCDFCGADIFQSFFECRRCAGRDAQDDSIIVCPSCYVEGRACRCLIMTPVQQYPMDILLDAQNRAQKLLNFEGYSRKGHRNVVKVVALSHQAIDKLVEHPGIFAAACRRFRILGRSMRPVLSCRSTKIPHPVAAAGVLSCKKCHSARCFKHILGCGYYVADALSLYLRDDTHAKWHAHHKAGPKRLAEAKIDVQRAQETGAPCNMSANLVLLAGKFTSCRPINDKVKAGWYDDASHLEIEMVESSDESFADSVLDESEEDDDYEIIEITSRDSSPELMPIYKRPALSRRRSGPKPPSPPREPSVVPFILLERLTSEQRERFFLKRPQIPTPISRLRSMPKGSPVSLAGESHKSIHSALASSFGQDKAVGPVVCHPMGAAETNQLPLLPVVSRAQLTTTISPKSPLASASQAPAQRNRTSTARPKGISVRRSKKEPNSPMDESPTRGRRRARDELSDDDKPFGKWMESVPRPKIGPPPKRSHVEKTQETPLPKKPQPKPRRRYIAHTSPITTVISIETAEVKDHNGQRPGDVPIRNRSGERDERADDVPSSSTRTIVQDSEVAGRKRTNSLPRFKRFKDPMPTSISTPSTYDASTHHFRSPSSVAASLYAPADVSVGTPSPAFTPAPSTLMGFSMADWPQMPASISLLSVPPSPPVPMSSSVSGGNGPTSQVNQAAGPSYHSLTEVFRRLESYEEDVRQSKLEKEELKTEMIRLKEELEQTRTESLETRRLREELEQAKMEAMSMKMENVQLRQQMYPSSVVIHGTSITANLNGADWPQNKRITTRGSEQQFVNNNRKFGPPGLRVPFRRDNQAQGYDRKWETRNGGQISRVPLPPPAPPYLQNTRNHISPIRPANDYPANKKRRRGNAGPDELYSAPLRRNEVDNGRELVQVRRNEDREPERTESEEFHREQRPCGAPGAKHEDEHDRRNVPRVSMNDFKRRKYAGKITLAPPPPPPLRTPPRRGFEEEDPFLPDEFAFGEDTNANTGGCALALALTPTRPFVPSTPVRPPSPSASISARPAVPAFRSAIATPRPVNELGLEMDSRVFTASNAANNDVDLTGNPWEGSKSKNPLLDSV